MNFDIEVFGYGFLILWKWTVLYICANWFIEISETKFFYLVFLFLNLIGLLSKYNKYDFFCLFPLTVLLGFCYLMQGFIYEFFFWYTKALFFINFKLSTPTSHINHGSIELKIIESIKPLSKYLIVSSQLPLFFLITKNFITTASNPAIYQNLLNCLLKFIQTDLTMVANLFYLLSCY